MTNLFVIPGHGAGDPGACGNGFTEAARVRALATRIGEISSGNVTLADFSRNYYADNGIRYLDLPTDTQIIELHLDSFSNRNARGGHVIIHPSFEPDAYDRSLAAFISSMFPGRAKSITQQQLGNADRAANRGYGYRLLECCFITNYDDMEKFNSGLTELAHGILNAFEIDTNVSSENDNAPQTENEHADESFGGTYRCTVDVLNVREAPSISSSVVTWYSNGQTVVLDDWYVIQDGYVWGRYTGAQSGKKRYVAVGKPTGGYDPNDFLVKI